jgi:hypothetical protein
MLIFKRFCILPLASKLCIYFSQIQRFKKSVLDKHNLQSWTADLTVYQQCVACTGIKTMLNKLPIRTGSLCDEFINLINSRLLMMYGISYLLWNNYIEFVFYYIKLSVSTFLTEPILLSCLILFFLYCLLPLLLWHFLFLF